MARIRYESWQPGADAIGVIGNAVAICADYAQQGYDLTLRQLYYQFVARGLIPNNQKSYNRLGTIVNKGRLAGFIDWDFIVDRTRNLEDLPHWDTPSNIISAAARSFANEKWRTQPTRVEVWVEKEALAGVVQRAAEAWDVPWFSCRGYVSQSELWAAGQRLGGYIRNGQNVIVLHLGDHDPSGIDMTRDIRDRLDLFVLNDWDRENPGRTDGEYLAAVRRAICEDIVEANGVEVDSPIEVRRIALNYDQVEQYNPPPNPAKLTDSRAAGYIDEYGSESWELDALDPATLDALIQAHIEDIVDDDLWHEATQIEREHITLLQECSTRWADVVELLSAVD